MSGHNDLDYTKAPIEHLKAYEGLKKFGIVGIVLISIVLLLMGAFLTNA